MLFVNRPRVVPVVFLVVVVVAVGSQMYPQRRDDGIQID